MKEDIPNDVTAFAAVIGILLRLLRLLMPKRKTDSAPFPKPEPGEKSKGCGCSRPKPEKRPCAGFQCPKEDAA